MTFDDAFAVLLRHEGGFVNDRRDAGGATRWGISKAAYPEEDIANLTIERARALYQRDYWGPAGCDALPDSMKLQVFDTAVNMGVKTAIRMLQQSVGATADGVLGPTTLQALASMPAPRLVARFNARRLTYYAGLPTWPAFGRGWAMRVADNLLEA